MSLTERQIKNARRGKCGECELKGTMIYFYNETQTWFCEDCLKKRTEMENKIKTGTCEICDSHNMLYYCSESDSYGSCETWHCKKCTQDDYWDERLCNKTFTCYKCDQRKRRNNCV